RMGQVRPVAVEVLDHVHGAVLEPPAELGAHDKGLHRGVGRPGLADRIEARPALLLTQPGLEGHPVDVEDHGLLLLLVAGDSPRAPVPCRLVGVAMRSGRSWLSPRGCWLRASRWSA